MTLMRLPLALVFLLALMLTAGVVALAAVWCWARTQVRIWRVRRYIAQVHRQAQQEWQRGRA